MTNTNDVHLEANRDNYLFKDFQKVYSSCEIKAKKPDKKPFIMVLDENHLLPPETIFIDDKKENLLSAQTLGIKTILFKNNNQLFKELEKLRILM
ncbi:MAG: HAD-IA family hydrolase [Nanoarchaeota archaeon]|nr:HAD-IA family hydrolase [Nanoarchaeota archaeon]